MTAAQIAARAEEAERPAGGTGLRQIPASNSMYSDPIFTDLPDEELRERLARCRRAGFKAAIAALERELLYRARKAAGQPTRKR